MPTDVDEEYVPPPAHDWSPAEDNRPHAYTRCDNCGQTDDHPKLHYGAETYHHDCIPARVLDDCNLELGDGLPEIIEACKAGKRGDALRKAIPDIKDRAMKATARKVAKS